MFVETRLEDAIWIREGFLIILCYWKGLTRQAFGETCERRQSIQRQNRRTILISKIRRSMAALRPSRTQRQTLPSTESGPCGKDSQWRQYAHSSYSFATERVQVIHLLGWDGEDATLARQRYGVSAIHSLEELLATLSDLSDAEVLRILTCVMAAETLEAGTHSPTLSEPRSASA